VHLAVPNRLHYDMARRALVRGKHVMCEKPLAMTARESAQLVTLAAESGLQAGVCYNVRFYPLNLEARSMVRGGALGQVYSIAGSYVQDWLLYETDYNWRVLADQGGALRAVADIGTHWIDLICTIAGLEVEAVFADLKIVHPVRRRPRGEVETFTGKLGAAGEAEPVAIETEDCGSVLLRFAGGARGTLWVSQTTAGRKNCLRYEIAGAERALAWNSERPNELWIGHRSEANEQLIRDPALLSPAARSYAGYPGGTRSRPASAPFIGASPTRRTRSCILPSRKGTARSCSAKPSSRATARSGGWCYRGGAGESTRPARPGRGECVSPPSALFTCC
jgi:predicted dehydrogenase